jgi:hypothetical protein
LLVSVLDGVVCDDSGTTREKASENGREATNAWYGRDVMLMVMVMMMMFDGLLIAADDGRDSGSSFCDAMAIYSNQLLRETDLNESIRLKSEDGRRNRMDPLEWYRSFKYEHRRGNIERKKNNEKITAQLWRCWVGERRLVFSDL